MSTMSPDIGYLWETCTIDEDKFPRVGAIVKQIELYKDRYMTVEASTTVPWQFIAALHYRESSLRFDRCLHNGDLLPGPTTHVPVGRGPFANWEMSAIDALKIEGLHKMKLGYLGAEGFLVMAEKYNGTGYRKHGVYSPYVWSWTNWSDERGKYTADGKFDRDALELQCGVAALLIGLGFKD
jgi:lysozyme family protein